MAWNEIRTALLVGEKSSSSSKNESSTTRSGTCSVEFQSALDPVPSTVAPGAANEFLTSSCYDPVSRGITSRGLARADVRDVLAHGVVIYSDAWDRLKLCKTPYDLPTPISHRKPRNTSTRQSQNQQLYLLLEKIMSTRIEEALKAAVNGARVMSLTLGL
ncbi:hypothetical protein EVAR_43373_1 [Eumeta japonica]|uniref:Uncharacterized protein n=1 Tax=Eumeta variegata TaxID=151549 RepID=A0A4C1WSJ7_EUMVA|nr:hypothetical protein EVAR_43373_1 [Eumeta japonica]